MLITLKNGKELDLEVTSLFLEYVEDYEGGMEKLQKDAGTTYAMNQLLYAIIASNYGELLTYSQAVRLVRIEDIEKILNFINQELPALTGENTISTNRTRHRI